MQGLNFQTSVDMNEVDARSLLNLSSVFSIEGDHQSLPS
jgi:hypothetical protein